MILFSDFCYDIRILNKIDITAVPVVNRSELPDIGASAKGHVLNGCHLCQRNLIKDADHFCLREKRI